MKDVALLAYTIYHKQYNLNDKHESLVIITACMYIDETNFTHNSKKHRLMDPALHSHNNIKGGVWKRPGPTIEILFVFD